MADRGIFRVDARPHYKGGTLSFLDGIKRALLFGPKPKASGFAQAIASLDIGYEERAFSMYAGEFQFGDETIVTSAPFLFTEQLGNKAWQEYLHCLMWLADFSSSKRQLHVHYALRLLGRWNRSKKSRKNIAVISKALIALCTHGSELALSADASLRVEFLNIVSETVARVNALKLRSTKEAFLQSVSLLYATTAFHGLEHFRKSASDMLNSTLDQLILQDGGPASREPQDLIDLMSLLLPLQAAMKLNRQIFPAAAADALHRMFPILAMLTHGDRIAALMGFDADAKSLKLAPQTGFARLTGGKTNLFVDTKSNFQFDFAIAAQRLFKSKCGNALLSTQAALHDSTNGVALQVTSSGGRERIYFLSADGTDLRVEDRFTSDIEIIFDLAAQVKIAATREGGVLLIAPDQTVWNLTLRGGEAQVEQNGTVLKICSTANGKMNWAFKKQTKIAKPNPRKKLPEPDLLA